MRRPADSQNLIYRRLLSIRVNELVHEFSDSERLHQIVLYHYFDGFSVGELASLYGISSSRVADVLATFRARFAKRYPYMEEFWRGIDRADI
jgi:DNA-directed RNA polymerase specialized sigma24 family protein